MQSFASYGHTPIGLQAHKGLGLGLGSGLGPKHFFNVAWLLGLGTPHVVASWQNDEFQPHTLLPLTPQALRLPVLCFRQLTWVGGGGVYMP